MKDRNVVLIIGEQIILYNVYFTFTCITFTQCAVCFVHSLSFLDNAFFKVRKKELENNNVIACL